LNPIIVKRIRQATQVLFLVAFLIFFISSGIVNPPPPWSVLFFQLDPLMMGTAIIVNRALVGGAVLALLTLILTLIFGRVWCGWICPLGTILEWITPRWGRSIKNNSRHRKPAELSNGWRSIKYILFLVIVIAAFLGNQTLLFLDPITLLYRSLSSAIWPAITAAAFQLENYFYQFNFLWSILDSWHGRVMAPLFGDIRPVFPSAWMIALIFLGVIALNWIAERFWCRYLCPLGGLLGIVSKMAFIRRQVGDGCTECSLCSPACPTGTIDAKRGYQSDPGECTVCYDCIVACKREDVAFRTHFPLWKPSEKQTYDLTRRQALLAFGIASVGVALAGVESIIRRAPRIWIRPPGARMTDFDSLCQRCGACVRVCPTQGLQPMLFDGGWQNFMTPQLIPRLGYCSYSCNACGQVCPSGAIPRLEIEEKQTTVIGLASVDKNRCLPWAYDTPCIVCEEACPLPEKAILLDDLEKDGSILRRPYVVKERCIGCGICEYQCPMGGESAIRVFTLTEAGR
jgi:polyferredoxin/Pyruvate/2-oxoacid:ferredoxin oxidoreductase delta subunit